MCLKDSQNGGEPVSKNDDKHRYIPGEVYKPSREQKVVAISSRVEYTIFIFRIATTRINVCLKLKIVYSALPSTTQRYQHNETVDASPGIY